jgi:hypothetical protein
LLLVDEAPRKNNLAALLEFTISSAGWTTLHLGAGPMSQTISVLATRTVSIESSNSDRASFSSVLSDSAASAASASSLSAQLAITQPPSTLSTLAVVDAPSTVLTTIFTPPSDCLSGAWTMTASDYGVLGCTRAYTASCFPSGFSEHQDLLYSPGVCPQGYNPGTMFSNITAPMVTTCVCCPL